MEKIKNLITKAIYSFIVNDKKELLDSRNYESAMSHRIAVYLEPLFPEYHIDCEYSRHLGNNKKIISYKWGDRVIRPDIIIHRERNSDSENLAIFELKMCWSESKKWKKDIEKLESSVRSISYSLWVFIGILKSRIDIVWIYPNGKKETIVIPTNDTTIPNSLKIMNSGLVRKYLNNASLFLLSWELMKSAIVDSIRDFYTSGYANGKFIVSDTYNTEMKRLDPKNIFKASNLWSKENWILTEKDLETIEELNLKRNNIAHRLAYILSEDEEDISYDDILRIGAIATKVDRWWIMNVEIPTNGELDPEWVDESSVFSGRTMLINFLLNEHLITTQEGH